MLVPQNYEEFWRRSGFDPDDVLHDGFFEGNQREWRKHQREVKKLHGRLERLNEDVLYSLDDDDIEVRPPGGGSVHGWGDPRSGETHELEPRGGVT